MAEGQAISVQTLAEKTLAAVVQHYAAAGDAHTLPDRQYIAAGSPDDVAWDCEQLTVGLVGIGWGQATDASATSPRPGGPASVMALRHAVLAVTLVRCSPTSDRHGKPPPASELHAAGTRYMRDAGLLSQALVELVAQLRQGLPREASVQAGVVDPIGPSGGFHGITTTLAITAANLE